MYTIQQATVQDVETIKQLAHEVWWPTYSPFLSTAQITFMLGDRYTTEVLTDQIVNHKQTFLLALKDEQIVAFAAYSPDGENPDIYRLHKLYSLPSTHGTGVGRTLLNAIYERVKAAGKNVIELNVHRSNPAKSFYEKMGFVITQTIDIPMGQYFLNDYIMRKVL